MAILKIFNVYDSKVGAYIEPIFKRSTGEALRCFIASVNSPGHDFGKFAGDYTLFELGIYDDETAKFSLLPTPKSLGVAVEFLEHFSDAKVPSRDYDSNGVMREVTHCTESGVELPTKQGKVG